MIHQQFKSKRPIKNPGWFTSKSSNTPILDESLRREKCFLSAYAKCKWKAGDIVKPHTKEQEDIYGDNLEVIHVESSYTNYIKTNVWPPHDNPLIVLVHSDKTQNTFICTPDFLIDK